MQIRERHHPWVGTDAAGLEYDNCNQHSMTNIREPVFLTPNSLPVRNRPATELVIFKVHNVKLSFNIWLVLYIYFILYS